MKKKLLSISALLITGTLACSQKGEYTSNRIVIPVKGDPYTFVAKTEMNHQVSLSKELVQSIGKWNLNSSGFEEARAEVSVSKAVAGQQPEKTIVDFSKLLDNTYSFSKMDPEGQTVELAPREQNETNPARYKFILRDGAYALSSISSSRGTMEVGTDLQILHTSIANDQSAFSILLYHPAPGDRALVSLTFAKNLGGEPKKTGHLLSTAYNYLFGPDIAVNWKSGQSIALCGDAPPPFRQAFHEAVQTWKGALQNRLKLESSDQASCPPFSDLNTRTVTFVDGWIEIYGADDAVLGETLDTPNLSASALIDGDVFILKKELQEAIDHYRPGLSVDSPEIYNRVEIQSMIKRTLTHELGHFLGLHHQFEKDSIMGYSGINELTTYDRDAIEGLYQ